MVHSGRRQRLGRCALGHRHWGRFGAAGLLLTDGRRVLLQHRAAWTHEGDTWAVPGGARDSHEDPITAALREADRGDLARPDASSTPCSECVDEHGGWSYTTIVARADAVLDVAPVNAESTAIRWWAIDEVAACACTAGSPPRWPTLRGLIAVAERAGGLP